MTAELFAQKPDQNDAFPSDREHFLEAVLASSGDCIKVLDLDAKLLFMSEGGQRAMEVSDFNAIQGCHWPDFWHGAGNAAAVEAIAAAKAGKAGRFRTQADTMAGTPKSWDVQVTPILGPDGRPKHLLSVSRDVTEAVAAETRLRESEERRRLALEIADIGTWDYDPLSGVVTCDERCCALCGLEPIQCTTHATLLERVHPTDRGSVQADIQAALVPPGTGRFHVEFSVIRPDAEEPCWISSTGQATFHEGSATRLVGVVRDVHERRKAEEQASLIGLEMQHRVKNTLTMVQAIVRQTLRAAESPQLAQAAIDQRLAALGRAHDLLTRRGWINSDLRTIVEVALNLHDDGVTGRFNVSGPRVMIQARGAMSLALLLHELATNAAKYGALSTGEGSVDIRWTIKAEPTRDDGLQRLDLFWREQGGPPVTPPTQRGFGSRLIERGLATALQGSAEIRFLNEGVVCHVDGLVETLPGQN